MSIESLPPPLNRVNKSDRVRRTLEYGEALFFQDSATAGLFYMISGTIDLKRATNTGHSVMIHRARSGDTFAEASLFSDTDHCTATAVCDAIVIECKRAAISRLLNTDIEFACSMASRFATQIQETRRRVELLSIRAANERILAALNDGLLVEDITTFAETIGLAPETVYRTLTQLSKKGHVEKTARGQYQINTIGPV